MSVVKCLIVTCRDYSDYWCTHKMIYDFNVGVVTTPWGYEEEEERIVQLKLGYKKRTGKEYR